MFSAEAANNDTLHRRFVYFVISCFLFDMKSKALSNNVKMSKYFWLAGCRQRRGELPALLVDLNLSNNNNGMWRVLIWQQSATMGWALVLNSQKFLYIYTNEIQSGLKSDWKTLTCIFDFELIAMNVPQNNPQQGYDDCFSSSLL